MKQSSNYAYATLDDIVFEGRNREYGAYLLRKLYVTNLWRGLAIAISVFLLLLSIPLISAKFFPGPDIEIPVLPQTLPIELQKIVIPNVDPPVAPPQKTDVNPATAPTHQHVIPKIAPDHTVTNPPGDPIPPGIDPGTTTTEGTGGTTPAVTPGTGTTPAVAPPVDEILNIAEVNPAFPGGQEALMKYLGSHISYPALAERNRVEGLVVVQFVVNEEGAISDIVVLKRLGGGTDEEAMRVIKNMPRWTPGRQSGKAVKVRFTLPIRFTLNK